MLVEETKQELVNFDFIDCEQLVGHTLVISTFLKYYFADINILKTSNHISFIRSQNN
jgi:hypothetical protein